MSSIGAVQANQISALTNTSISATDAAKIAELTQGNVLVGMLQANAAKKAELQVGLQDTLALSSTIQGLDPNAAVGTVITSSPDKAQDLAAFMRAHPDVWKPGDGGIVFKDAQGQPVTDLASGGIVSVEVAPPGAKTLAQVKDDGQQALVDQSQSIMRNIQMVDAIDQKTRATMGKIIGNFR